jgi:hypothetical protein
MKVVPSYGDNYGLSAKVVKRYSLDVGFSAKVCKCKSILSVWLVMVY